MPNLWVLNGHLVSGLATPTAKDSDVQNDDQDITEGHKVSGSIEFVDVGPTLPWLLHPV